MSVIRVKADVQPFICGERSSSLLLSFNSLFFKLFSLLIRIGNCWKNGCSAGVFAYAIGAEVPEIAKYPVKFPDNREFSWRLVRSALRRQPGSPAVGDGLQPAPHRPGNPGFSRIRLCLQTPDLPISGPKLPKVSGPVRGNSRFAEIFGGDRFDHDCRPINTVQPHQFMPSRSSIIGISTNSGTEFLRNLKMVARAPSTSHSPRRKG
jgi:hypothetical protein